MPFLFKLSKRVARLRSHALLVAAAVVAGACAKGVVSPPAGGTPPVTIHLSATDAAPGGSVAAELRATERLAAIQETVAFDPQRLRYERPGDGPDLVVVNDQAAAQGSLKVLATNPQGLAPAGVTLVFTVTASGYTDGIRGTLEIAVAPDDRLVWGAATAGLTRAAAASPSGGYRFGDVTLDGLINVWDVLLMSRVSGGTATLTPQAFLLGNVSPVNGGATATGVPPTCDPATTCRPGVTPGDALDPNGRIDNEDATAIANAAVGVAVPVVGELSPAGPGTPDTAVASVTVSPATANLHIGQTVQLTATPKNAAGSILTGRTVTWTSSNPSVATVSPSGQMTGVTPGSASITATSEGKSGSTTITVTTIPVASVAISPATANIRARQTVQLTATPKDSAGGILAGRTVMWASGDSSIVVVRTTGLVTSVAPGTAPITAMSEGKNSSAAITVALVPVASMTISPATASLQL